MYQHTKDGVITLSKPKSKGIKQLHVISRGIPDNYECDKTSFLENEAFRDHASFFMNNITMNNALHKQAKNNPIPDLVEDESWEFQGQSDAYDILVDESQRPQWVTVHSIDAHKIFTKDWLEQKIAEALHAEQNATYTGVKAHIKLKPGAKNLLKNSKPIVQSPELVGFMRQHLDDMINLGQIEEVHEVTGNASPTFLVKKPGKKDYNSYKAWRMVVNMKDPNLHTIRDPYPLPLIKAIFQDIATWGDKYFAKMDMTNGFSQMPLAEEDRWITTFTTPHGLFRYKVLPMGACNSPSIFQRENDRILADAQKEGRCKHVKIYVDDIFVGGRSLEELLKNVEEVIAEFLRHGRTMNFSKSEFGLTKATFLGFTLAADGSVSVDEDVFDVVSRKLKDILSSSQLIADPKKKAQSLLGTLNYFREFVFNFSHKVEFINAFLRKGNDSPWTQKEDDRVGEILIELQNSGRIRPIDVNKKVIVQCDASGHGIAYIALQTDENGHYLICDMNSASLTKGQREYCASYREAIALAFAVEYLRLKIMPEKIHAYTDNSALIHIFGKTVENKPILKIAEFLDQQGITLTHIKGSENGGSDSLSRIHLAFINSGWRLIPDAELASYAPLPSLSKPYLSRIRIPAAAELVLLLFSGGDASKIRQMVNDMKTRWMLATAQLVEGLNLLQQAVRTNAVLTRDEALSMTLGNTRTQYTKDLYKFILDNKDEFPNIKTKLELDNPGRKQATIIPIGLAHHLLNLLKSLQTIHDSAKTGHIKDWGTQIKTDVKEFQHPPMTFADAVKSVNSMKDASVSCIHTKYDGKAKQPNDTTQATLNKVLDCLLRGWINKSTREIIKTWLRC